MIFSVNEVTASDYGLNLAREIGTDLLIRGCFKWNRAPNLAKFRPTIDQAHAFGALFGGGITCSALYDRENGITREQLLDMATRGSDGQLVDAWDTRGVRHGSLSSPAYLDYLFRWCREQIDGGVDYLFMDENNAALSRKEGFDDHSLADFRGYLLSECPQTRGWKPDDPRWSNTWQVALTDHTVCQDGTMASFDYRAHLRAHGSIENPTRKEDVLRSLWHQFRTWRDDRAWKALTDRIRAYAQEHGRQVLISGNGLVKYVDLQVLGVWGQWVTKDGHIELSEPQLAHWHELVQRGRALAGKRVPVVLFHDWGFGHPPFPWLAVPPAERETWIRTRGAEIYAAGALFAFPVLGPFGCDAGKDGTLPLMARQAAFYKAHRNLYLQADYLGTASLQSQTPNLSLAAWAQPNPRAIILHAINRNVVQGILQPQKAVVIELPLDRIPKRANVISPDFAGERAATCRLTGGHLEVTLGDLDAYAVVILEYDNAVNLRQLRDPARTATNNRWARPILNEFPILPDGTVANAEELNGTLQGMLHKELRNPPTFLANATTEGKLLVHVRAVARLGARLEYRVDGETKQVVELPDRDGKNDAGALEYNKTYRFPIPVGAHRLTVDNVGGDWASITWVTFDGAFAPWPEPAQQ